MSYREPYWRYAERLRAERLRSYPERFSACTDCGALEGQYCRDVRRGWEWRECIQPHASRLLEGQPVRPLQTLPHSGGFPSSFRDACNPDTSVPYFLDMISGRTEP